MRQWCAARQRNIGGLASAAQLWTLAQLWYSNRLSPDWRRPTKDEAEARFAAAGLTGPFWQLGL